MLDLLLKILVKLSVDAKIPLRSHTPDCWRQISIATNLDCQKHFR